MVGFFMSQKMETDKKDIFQTKLPLVFGFSPKNPLQPLHFCSKTTGNYFNP